MQSEFLKPDKQNERANEEFEARAGHHSEDLFDLNESAGEKIDLATGKPIDNSTHTGLEGLDVIDSGTKDALPPVEEPEDEAERWLREHDPNYKRSKLN